MGQQGGGHRIAGKALERFAIQGEGQGLVAINAAALRETECTASGCVVRCRLRHGSSLWLAMTTDSMSCVTV